MKKYLFFLGLFCLLFLNSCLFPKKIVYLEDMTPEQSYDVSKMPVMKVQVGDRLSIMVSSKNIELAAPFKQESGAYVTSDNGKIDAIGQTSVFQKGYLVDQSGNIDFPVLGTLRVMDLSIEEVKELIKSRLIKGSFIGDPTVAIELTNMKIIMMGENGNSIVSVPEGKITIIEAINKAGGLTNNAQLDKITVIREENGKRNVYYNNMKSHDIFDSPTYYLKQNDIIYTPSRGGTMTAKEENGWRYIGFFGTLLGLFISITAFLSK